MTKEGYQPIKKETIKIIPPNTGSHVYMKKDSYTWEDMDRSYWEGFDTAKGKMEKRIEELEKENAELREKECWKIVKSFWNKQEVLKMTDEEMAEEWAGWYWGASLSAKRAIEEAFLAGLKAGRPKWHKVADGDLPKEEDLEMQVLCFTHDGYQLLSLFSDPKPIFKGYGVIAWCEIPKYKEE